MRKVTMLLLFLLMSVTSAFAASETLEAMIAELEGKDPQTITQERQEQDEEKFAADLEKERIALKKKLRWETDKFNGTVGYWSKKTPISTITGPGSIYFTLHDTTSGPLLKCRYGFINDKWIFLREIRVNIDGEIHFVRMFGVSKKPYYGWEYYDDALSPADEAFYLQIINSEKAMVRFIGLNGNVIDFQVSKRQKEALSEVLRYYHIREYQVKDITMETYLEKVVKIQR